MHLKHLAKKMIKEAGRLVPPDLLMRRRYPVLLPFYHAVSSERLPHVMNYPYRTEDEFVSELEFLLKHYRPVGLDELVASKSRNSCVFHLSFDDGLRQCYDIIAPVLLRKGVPATFFVNPAFIDNQGIFHRYKAGIILNYLQNNPDDAGILKNFGLTPDTLLKIPRHTSHVLDQLAHEISLSMEDFLRDYKPYMSESNLHELSGQGFTIGAHSWDHPEFWMLDGEQQLMQISKSMDWVVQRFSPAIKAFAFPYSDAGISERLLTDVLSHRLCDVTFGTSGLKYGKVANHFQRFPCETEDPLPIALRKEMAYSLVRQWTGISRPAKY